jgi:hypothetical protein
MPDNKDELRYEPRQYGKSFKAWQQFIAYSRNGEEIVYRTKEGDICSPAQVKRLLTAQLKSLKAKLPEKYDTDGYSRTGGVGPVLFEHNKVIDQVNKLLDELIGE